MKTLYKLLFSLTSVFLVACSASYDKYIDEGKTRLSYTNIEMKLPKMLTEKDTDGYNYQSKDKKFTLSVVVDDSGFNQAKKQSFNNKSSKTNNLSTSLLNASSDSFLDQGRFNNSQYILYAKRHGKDGSILIRFLIESDSDETHAKLLGIAKASIKTISILQSPIIMSEGLVYKTEVIDDMYIAMRLNGIAVYKKGDMSISVSHLDNSFDTQTVTHINQQLMFDSKASCENITIEKSNSIVVSKQQTNTQLRAQKCGSVTYKEYRTRVNHGGDSYLLVNMRLPTNNTNSEYKNFYNEFLQKLTISQ